MLMSAPCRLLVHTCPVCGASADRKITLLISHHSRDFGVTESFTGRGQHIRRCRRRRAYVTQPEESAASVHFHRDREHLSPALPLSLCPQ
jgi:hypothetical protein